MKTLLILLLTAQSAFAYDMIITGNDAVFAKWKCSKKNFEKAAFSDKERDDFLAANSTNGIVIGDFVNVFPSTDTLAIMAEIKLDFNQLSGFAIERELRERTDPNKIVLEWTKLRSDQMNQLAAKIGLGYDVSGSTTALQIKLDTLKQRFINSAKP